MSSKPHTLLENLKLSLGYLGSRNTLKTTLGAAGPLIRQHLPAALYDTSLTGIFNYLPISPTLITAGQPTEAQLAAVQRAGFQRVINLAPHGGENSLKDERGTVEGLGLQYTHIPVDYKNPTEADFTAFCSAMENARAVKTLVHCAANMRVSGFVYRYRCQVLKEDPTVARADLVKIWEPFGPWVEFIERPFTQG